MSYEKSVGDIVCRFNTEVLELQRYIGFIKAKSSVYIRHIFDINKVLRENALPHLRPKVRDRDQVAKSLTKTARIPDPMAKLKKAKDIDGYISQFPADIQVILEKVRETIHQAALEAKETISYMMPAFK
jgi:hypothetical protein